MNLSQLQIQTFSAMSETDDGEYAYKRAYDLYAANPRLRRKVRQLQRTFGPDVRDTIDWLATMVKPNLRRHVLRYQRKGGKRLVDMFAKKQIDEQDVAAFALLYVIQQMRYQDLYGVLPSVSQQIRSALRAGDLNRLQEIIEENI